MKELNDASIKLAEELHKIGFLKQFKIVYGIDDKTYSVEVKRR